MNTRLEREKADLQKQLQTLQSSASLAINQANESIQLLKQAVSQSQNKQEAKTEAVAKLDTPRVVIRVGGDVPVDLDKDLRDRISSKGKYSLSVEGGMPFTGTSGLRFFYKDDMGLAREVAQAANETLKQFGVSNKTIPIVDLSGLAIKPVAGTVELWLNMDDGRLL